MELRCHNFLVYMGGGTPGHSLSKEEGGEESFSKMGMEPNSLVCRAPPSAIRMCVVRTRVYFSLGDPAIPESSENSQRK